MKTLLYRLRRLLQGRRRDDEIREELAFHLEEDEADRVDAGVGADAAKRAARLDLGNATLHAEDTRAVWISRVVERIAQDLRYALRRMRRSPVFSIVAIASPATVRPLPGSSSGRRRTRSWCARGAHCLRYAIWTPVVESTRSAASMRLVSSTGWSGESAYSVARRVRIASMRAPFFGWKNRDASQNVSVK